jgi:prepilin-type N-terminal cleavage/methylation domain-containing protein
VKNNSQGYTLVELLITLALMGLVFIIAGSAIYQLNTVTQYGNERLTEMHELQNAYLWFSRDGQEALAAGGNGNLTFTLADRSLVSYNLSNGTLQRVAGSQTRSLVRHVTAWSVSVQDNLVTMNLTTAPGGAEGNSEESVQRSYQVHLRVQP